MLYATLAYSGRYATVAYLACLGLWLCLAGCAQQRAGYVVLGSSPATGAVAAGEIYPLAGGESTWLVTAGDDAGEHVVRRRGETTEHSAAWAEEESDRRSEYWRTDEWGNIIMPAVAEHGDRAITLFDPPLFIAFAEMPAGEAFRQVVEMRVLDTRRTGRLKDEGTAVRTIEYAGDHRIRTALGEFDTRRIEITFIADLHMATAENKATLYVARGIGPIVEERSESVRALGIPVRSRRQTLVLLSGPGMDADAHPFDR